MWPTCVSTYINCNDSLYIVWTQTSYYINGLHSGSKPSVLDAAVHWSHCPGTENVFLLNANWTVGVKQRVQTPKNKSVRGIRCRATADPNTHTHTHNTLTCLFPLSAEPVQLSACKETMWSTDLFFFFVLPAWTSRQPHVQLVKFAPDVNKYLDNMQLF